LERREGNRALGLDACRAEYEPALGHRPNLTEQRGLADSGLTQNEEH